uniref:ABC transporter n=1 Tax=uncultured Thiotrichaceae bacterium TaxID=298394 RepID=A0A6S6SDH0_9GAMM|nr:MAG: ABC transporter [uncultured Thiotrichaceae bacterium]
MHEATTQINFTQLSKRFGKRQILNNTNLTLETGECVLLTGKNGTGKTTLMRILAGLEKPDSCQIQLSNQHGTQNYRWSQFRNTLQSRIMYLHQQPFMFSGTVKKNLNFALPPIMAKAERREQIHQIAEWAGLGDILESNAKSLSGGECQRVAIARARLRNPQALLLDEPTANMDSDARSKTLEMLQQLREENIALLLATHDPALFENAASRFLHLEKQQITTTPAAYPTSVSAAA